MTQQALEEDLYFIQYTTTAIFTLVFEFKTFYDIDICILVFCNIPDNNNHSLIIIVLTRKKVKMIWKCPLGILCNNFTLHIH